MAQPLVSIVMCVFNGERFLKQQIESLLFQTYQQFELIIMDDASTDSSISIIKEYQEKDNRIKIHQNELNLGFNRNFEKGISYSSGELIAICDQDDIWISTKIEELVQNIGSNILIYSNSSLIDENGLDLNKKLNEKLQHVDLPGYKSFLDGNFVTGHTCLFSRELSKYILPIPEGVLYYDWWIGFVASYIGSVKYFDKRLTRYRIHSNSVIQKFRKNEESREVKRLKLSTQLKAFSSQKFISNADKQFIEDFRKKKEIAYKNLLNFTKCYILVLKYHRSIYPWYKKPLIKKLNFLRKQCL